MTTLVSMTMLRLSVYKTWPLPLVQVAGTYPTSARHCKLDSGVSE